MQWNLVHILTPYTNPSIFCYLLLDLPTCLLLSGFVTKIPKLLQSSVKKVADFCYVILFINIIFRGFTNIHDSAPPNRHFSILKKTINMSLKAVANSETPCTSHTEQNLQSLTNIHDYRGLR